MAEGKLIVELDQAKIMQILPMDEVINTSEGVTFLNQWAVPHWDWVKSVQVGAVQVSKETAEYIIGRLKDVLPGQRQAVMMLWLNYGWSINESLPNWRCQINFNKIRYNEEEQK